MANLDQRQSAVAAVLRLAPAFLMGVVMAFLAAQAQAQTFTVIHTFSGGVGGGFPQAGLTMDRVGNFYGTTRCGAYGDCYSTGGSVFKLTHSGSGWVLHPIYEFSATGSDGALPQSRVIVGPNGTLYGVTPTGGSANDGVIYNLRPPAQPCKAAVCPWSQTLLHQFLGGSDGAAPYGEVVFDSAGNFYGTAAGGGSFQRGVIYKMTRSGNSWSYSVLYNFTGAADGKNPMSGLTFDLAGNLYGTTYQGTSDHGTVFELTPSGSGWTLTTVYRFEDNNAGGIVNGGVIFDAFGNLYGATVSYGPPGDAGTVYELSPANGLWNFSMLAGLPENGYSDGGSYASPALDSAGNLYGTSLVGGHGLYAQGSVFKVSPGNGGWSYIELYDFGGGRDGGNPYSNVVVDASGNLYGTASDGGAMGLGVVWEITP